MAGQFAKLTIPLPQRLHCLVFLLGSIFCISFFPQHRSEWAFGSRSGKVARLEAMLEE